MRRILALIVACAIGTMGATYYIDPAGSDGAAGSSAAPWATLGYGIGQLASGDTLYVNWGTYAGEWGTVISDSTVSGTAGDLTWVIGRFGPDGEWPVFDGYTLTDTSAADTSVVAFVSGPNGLLHHIGIKNLEFRSYHARTARKGPGIIKIAHPIAGAALGDTLWERVSTMWWIENIRVTEGSTRMDTLMNPVTLIGIDQDTTTTYTDSLVVLGTYAESQYQNVIDMRGRVSNAVIEGNEMHGSLSHIPLSGGDEPDGIRNDIRCDDCFVAGNTVSARDHGITLFGSRNTVWRNTVYGGNDDLYWFGASVPTGASGEANLLQENIGWYSADDGVDLRTIKTGIYGNTFYGIQDAFVHIDGSALSDSSNIRYNVFSNTKDTGEAAIDINVTNYSQVASFLLADNVFYDPDGSMNIALLSLSPFISTSVTVAQANDSTWASNNFDGIPALADTADAINLRPLSTSPANGRGMPGRLMAGALECADCLLVPFTVNGTNPDSITADIRDQRGRVVRSVPALGVHQLEPFSRYLVDVDLDSSRVGRAYVQGYLYDGGATQRKPFTPDVFDIQVPALYADATEAALADDFAAIDVSGSGITADDIDDIATAVWAAPDSTKVVNSFTYYPNTDGAFRDSTSEAQIAKAILEWSGYQGRDASNATVSWRIDVVPTETEITTGVDAALAGDFADIPDDIFSSVNEYQGPNPANSFGNEMGQIYDKVNAALTGGYVVTDIGTGNAGGENAQLTAAAAVWESLLVVDGFAALRDSIVTRGNAAWTTGSGGGGSLGNGEFSHVIAAKSSADSSAVSGARVMVYSSDGTTLYVNTTTPTSGFITANLDSASYQYRISSPATYNPASAAFTVTGDNDTTSVYLDPLAISGATDPTRCAMVYNTMDILGEVIADLIIEVRPQSRYSALTTGGGSVVIDQSWAVFDTTDVNGQAVAELIRSSEYDQGTILYQFRARTGDVNFPLVERVTVPDDTLATVAGNIE